MYDIEKTANKMRQACIVGTALLCFSFASAEVQAEDARVSDLNTVPTARFIKADTMALSLETLDPYAQVAFGYQFSDFFYLQFQQNFQVSSLRDEADYVAPGLDFKLKLRDESTFWPQVALGMENAIGNQRLASEYLVASKRLSHFDITGGVAWGRLGSGAHMRNPLRMLSSHFDEDRIAETYDSESNNARHWFTGEDIGFFGGVAYHTPFLKNAVITLDYNNASYDLERQAIQNFNAPSPWSIGVQYTPAPWVELSTALVGREKMMARARFFENPENFVAHDTIVMRAPYWPKFSLKFEEVVSLTEEDETILNRSSIILNASKDFHLNFSGGLGLRYNAGYNYEHFYLSRPYAEDTVRGDEFEFANNAFNLDRAYLAYKSTLFKNTELALTGGYLEELFAGFGGEVLYQTEAHPWMIGGEIWHSFKRDPFSSLATRVKSGSTTTGHLNLGYKIEDSNLLAKLSLGKYLAGDTGGTFALENKFDNGAKLEGFVTVTNKRDRGILNEDEDYYAGLTLTFPFQIPYTDSLSSVCCDADVQIRPIARSAGQKLNKPISLF